MRTRAGIILIEDNKVALIERHHAGLEYYVFPGGGVDEGETIEQAAIREAMEELGVEVIIKQQVAAVIFEYGMQYYFLVKRVAGEFGSGTGEEFSADPGDPQEGIYAPVWMPIEELPRHEKVFPIDVAKLALKAQTDGWPKKPLIFIEKTK